VICDPGDVAVVPFPFSERPGTKRRPALVLSQRAFNDSGHSVLAMITTGARSPWPGDTVIEEFAAAGLQRPCIARLKLFTLDNRLILKRAGRLADRDQEAVLRHLRQHLG